MKSFIQKVVRWSKTHRIVSVVVLSALVVTSYGVVRAFNGTTVETRYVLAAVERSNIIASVTGSGQVSSSDQVDLTAKASGNLISLNVRAGQEVGMGALIAQIDSGDAYYDLETAQLSYEKLVTIDPDNVEGAKKELEEAYTTARATMNSASTGMDSVMSDLKTLYNCNNGYLDNCGSYSVGDTAKAYKEKAEAAWYKADTLIYEFIKVYRTISNSSTPQEIEGAVASAHTGAVAVVEAAKYAYDATVYFRNSASSGTQQVKANEALTLVSPLTSSSNTVLSNILAAQDSIKASQKNLRDLQKGPDALDVRSSELSLRQKQDALSDYVVRAPFAGIIASVTAKKGTTVNNGASIATLITKKKIAEISLNEIDVAKIKAGQKATLTFDAFDDLTITGEVTEVDLVGAVSQGVVNYKVKIAFDTDDGKVKPGMTVSASIITDMKQSVLVVPTSAVKTQGTMSYVEVTDQAASQNQASQMAGVLLGTPPQRVEVTTGFTNDESIEIVSGLEEGQHYISRTITSGTQATQSAPSLFGGGTTGRPTGGAGGFGGGGMRTFTR